MKTNLCSRYIEEIAANAADAGALSAEAREHLRGCAACRAKADELRAVAAIHMEAAANLPEPKRRPVQPITYRLERVMMEDAAEPRRTFAIPLRPIVAGLIALLLLAAVLFSSRGPRKLPVVEPIATRELPETVASTGPVEPTILALRNEVQKGREQILASMPISSGMQHYRLKDVESELGN